MCRLIIKNKRNFSIVIPVQILHDSQVDKTENISVKYLLKAEVAELADALRSGRSESILMWVQVPPSA